MTIYPVTSPEFARYGRVISGYEGECAAITGALNAHTPLPEATGYVPEEPALQQLPQAQVLGPRLNCLEYHRDSEFNLGTEDFILLLAKQEEIENGQLDTARVKAFRVPAGVLVEVYATTLHYAPCHTDPAKGFRVMVALPKGTNTDKPELPVQGGDDAWLWACNKWLLAHPDSDEARQGAAAALVGENIDIAAAL